MSPRRILGDSQPKPRPNRPKPCLPYIFLPLQNFNLSANPKESAYLLKAITIYRYRSRPYAIESLMGNTICKT
jgi:hypothetical protein